MSTMIGLYRIALLPAADEQAFITHMHGVVFKNVSALQLTRITRGFTHQLLRVRGDLRQYVWHTTVELQTSAGYDFEQNITKVQEAIESFGVLVGVETYSGVGE